MIALGSRKILVYFCFILCYDSARPRQNLILLFFHCIFLFFWMQFSFHFHLSLFLFHFIFIFDFQLKFIFVSFYFWFSMYKRLIQVLIIFCFTFLSTKLFSWKVFSQNLWQISSDSDRPPYSSPTTPLSLPLSAVWTVWWEPVPLTAYGRLAGLQDLPAMGAVFK